MKLLVHLAFWLGSVSALRWIKTERRGAMARGRGMVPRAAVDSVGVTGFDEERWAVGAPRSFRTELVGRDLETAPTLSAREPSLDASGPPVAESQNSDLDFYECQNANPAPEDADCQAIVDQVSSLDQRVVLQRGACLTFAYRSCQGYFCAPCQTLATSAGFVGAQLASAESLCVADGNAGAVVGERPPQWEAGFLRAGSGGPPTFDVC